ncbi:hypothetical protein HYH03_005314 [Edaphochlamys debaryana]|uniref:AAA+ ATPase domain-containing protein n=1 Tax=Edaphochlamys debaryana TaxID=47281 RepID=A0A835YF63_9CHLO|nr:hypothetical protein HYH03_005314 [Edaphochlamys debaryana]|eukprot:KAG2496489.1 hypothetical protein HYH03_005314 [Edaphochlamys debaryana]
MRPQGMPASSATLAAASKQSLRLPHASTHAGVLSLTLGAALLTLLAAGPSPALASRCGEVSQALGLYHLGWCTDHTSTGDPRATCAALLPHLQGSVVQQCQAIVPMFEAVCGHLRSVARGTAQKPLVMSLHGPPGVGKTFSALLIPQALFYDSPEDGAKKCKGRGCRGALFLTRGDFESYERLESHVSAHVLRSTNPYILIDDFDKFDCRMRTYLRALLDTSVVADSSLRRGLERAIIIFTSNAGSDLVEEYGRRVVTPGVSGSQAMCDRLVSNRLHADLKQTVTQELGGRAQCGGVLGNLMGKIDRFLGFTPFHRDGVESFIRYKLRDKSPSHVDRLVAQLLKDRFVFDQHGFTAEAGNQIQNAIDLEDD